MPWTIGFFWAFLFGAGAVVMLITAIYFLYKALEDRRSTGTWAGFGLTAVAVLVLAYLSYFANTHFMVGVNERALVIDYQQRIVGVYPAGIQEKPFFGAQIQYWPAESLRQVHVALNSSILPIAKTSDGKTSDGSMSASTKDGMSIWLTVDSYVDLSNLDVAAAYKKVNGDFSLFYQNYLLPQIANQARLTTGDFDTLEHNTKKPEWTKKFEARTQEFLSGQEQGLGIRLVSAKTIMSWDFVNPADGNAFDTANRAGFLVTQRTNEKAALDIEAQMAIVRGQMLESTAKGVTGSMDVVVKYMMAQPPDARLIAMQYLTVLRDMEFLRLQGEQKPSVLMPPGGTSVMPTYNVAPTAPTK